MNSDFIYYVISGFVLLLIPILFIGSFWLRGFFWSFAKVKAGQGKYVLVRVRSQLRDYFRPGFVIDGTLRYTDSKKNGRTLVLPETKDAFYRAYGVFNIDVDEEKNAIFLRDASAVPGYDAEKFDDLLLRALMKPAFGDNKTLIILIIVVLILLLLFVDVFYGYKTYQAIINNAAQASIGTIKAGV